jgi:integrase
MIADGLAPLTIRKRLQWAKTWFKAAKRKRLISENPFDEVTINGTMPDKKHFITQVDAKALLNACPDADWRTIVALSRHGGLRCPSEVLSLRWEDIDWENQRIEVQSPKTEHHEGKGTRTIPLFPELYPHLRTSFERAPDGAVYVVDERFRKSAMGKSGWKNCNLRTTFEKIIKRAGLKKWPRLFHNLRSSRQTELEDEFPSHVVCAWLGNSEKVAKKHYLQVTPDHFKKAIKTEGGNGRGEGEAKPEAVAKQKAKQHPAAIDRILMQI